MQKRRVAIIGTASPTEKAYMYVKKQASRFVARGWEVSTGAADGIDNAAMWAAAEIDPSALHIFLPWSSYNREKIPQGVGSLTVYNEKIHKEWSDSVYQFHPVGASLNRGPFALHSRNYGIIMVPRPVDLVVALPSNKLGGGGTGQGMRIAQHYGIPLLDLNKKEDQEALIRDWLDIKPKEKVKKPLRVYTAQYGYSGPNRLDTTVKTAPLSAFATRWDLVMGHKDGKVSDQQYAEGYLGELYNRHIRLADEWVTLLNQEEVVLVCFCKECKFCHRVIFARVLASQCGAVYVGEISAGGKIIPAEEVFSKSLPLNVLAMCDSFELPGLKKAEIKPDASAASYVHVVEGDLLKSDCTVIAHQANCHNTMGTGIAKQIKDRYPQAFMADKAFGSGSGKPYMPTERLGMYSWCFIDERPIAIFNMYGQLGYGRDKRYTNYEALYKAMRGVFDECATLRMGGYPVKFGMPYKIGCANAGGDWAIVSKIIEELANEFQMPVYLYRKGRYS